ncbi:hypothetical protein V2A60_003744 [Cordyceps javanica]
MWRPILILFTALRVTALPAANEYDECKRNDLYESLQRDGESFCTRLLDPECYTSVTTPAKYATYDAGKLSSYCSCIYEPCHRHTTSSTTESLPPYTQTSSHSQSSTSFPASNSSSTHTHAPGPPWSTTNTTLPTATAPYPSKNETITIIPAPTTTSSEAGVTSVTALPGNTTSTQTSSATSPTSSETRVTSVTVVPGNTTSTQESTTASPTSPLSDITSTTVLSSDTSSTLWSNTSSLTSQVPVSLTTVPVNTTSTVGSNTTSPTATPTPTTFPVANFTSVLRGPAPSSQACHHRPGARDGATHVAALQNEEIRRQNLTLAFPYVGSVSFDDDNITPLYLSVRDAAKGSHLIDVSDPSAVTIFDSRNNSLRLNLTGIHLVTGHCNLTVSYLIDNMYGQLAQQSLELCSKGPKNLLAGEQTFTQTLVLRDQCDGPVGPRVRRYPDLRVDDEQCIAVPTDNTNGTWTFDCPWQSAGSTVQRCMSSLTRNAIEFLLYDPFNGGCADVSSVVTLLEASAQDMLNMTAIQQELYNQIGNDTSLLHKVDDTVMYYLQLWETLKSTLSKTRGLNPGRGSNLKQYLDTYNRYRNFAADACASLNGSVAPAVLSLTAGSSTIPVLASLQDMPVAGGNPLAARVQDPAKIACCPNGGVAVTDPDTGRCAYPSAALVPGTDCVCGKTANLASVAFRYRQCDNFVSQCQADSDCAAAGYPGYQCLIGSCCGQGVCFDPFECSRPDVVLLPGSVE